MHGRSRDSDVRCAMGFAIRQIGKKRLSPPKWHTVAFRTGRAVSVGVEAEWCWFRMTNLARRPRTKAATQGKKKIGGVGNMGARRN